jgi:O-antigen/teichoic acid export membrane protein
MNNTFIKIKKNFYYTSISNLLSLLVSLIVVLIVPKLVGVEEFGYWQLYIFYSAYVGFLHFGWSDGIYIRYGGKNYQDLDKKLFFSQFYLFVIMQLILAVIFFACSFWFLQDEKRVLIIQMTILCMVIINIRSFLLIILQATNRIQAYAKVIIVEQIFYFGLISILLLIGTRDFKLLIVADLVGKSITLIYVIYYCKNIVFQKVSVFQISFKEALENINVGVKVMLAYIASLLIIGVVRFGIERSWSVVTFGKVSLVLSISKLVLLFINALGIIVFPVLRRTNIEKLPVIYIYMRDLSMAILFGILITYYPLKVLITAWLPEYADSLIYMAILFPMVIFEGKTALLINTYLKILRREKLMLKINILSLLLGIIVTFLTTIVIENLNLAVISIIFLLALRSILGEVLLSKILNIFIYKDILLELILVLIFILVGLFINSWNSVFLYIISYIIYLVIKRKDIITTIKNIKILTKA